MDDTETDVIPLLSAVAEGTSKALPVGARQAVLRKLDLLRATSPTPSLVLLYEEVALTLHLLEGHLIGRNETGFGEQQARLARLLDDLSCHSPPAENTQVNGIRLRAFVTRIYRAAHNEERKDIHLQIAPA